MATVNVTQLRDLLSTDVAPVLINVLPGDIFAVGRIPGSVNACVFEMVFVSAVQKLAPDKTKPIVVYGAGEGSLDAQVAADKLSTFGFTQVNALGGGLPAWQAAGLPVEGEGSLPAHRSFDGSYKVDAEASVIHWTGRNLFNHHNGTLKLSAGSIELANNRLLNAKFELDMQTIACEDLTDSQWNAMLIKHLRNADFFDVDHYPTGSFVGDIGGRHPRGI